MITTKDPSRRRPSSIVLALLIVFVLGIGQPRVQAAILNVDNDVGAGCSDATGTPYCTVQSAVNAASNGDTIEIADGTYTELLTIGKNLRLRGGGSSTNTCTPTLGVDTLLAGGLPLVGPVVTIQAGARVRMVNLIILDGQATLGGGVFNAGDLWLYHVNICNNEASDLGGGVYTEGRVILSQTSVHDNQVRFGTSKGGGVYVVNGGLATIINNSEIRGNLADSGGGIAIETGARLAMSRSTVSSNTACESCANIDLIAQGGGIWNQGTALISDSTIDENFVDAGLSANGSGGGIYNGSTGKLILGRSALTRNEVSYTGLGLPLPEGGGLYNEGTASLISTTVGLNILPDAVPSKGAGVHSEGDLSLNNVTITQNFGYFGHGQGISQDSSGIVQIRNSIVAHQLLGEDCRGTITSADYNIISDSSCFVAAAANDQLSTDPRLDTALQINSGLTKTYNLLEDSPAIDAGNPAGCLADLNANGVATQLLLGDQRRNFRVDVPNAGNNGPSAVCDIGAVEFNLLVNGMLEDDRDEDGLPDDWNFVNLSSADGLVCAPGIAHFARCAFLLEGNGLGNNELSQTLTRSGLANDNYTVTVFHEVTDITFGTPRVVLRFESDGVLTEEFQMNLNSSDHPYEEAGATLMTTMAYDQVKVIIDGNPAGQLLIDDISLVQHP